MPIQYGPPIQAKTPQELSDATTFYNAYKNLYYGGAQGNIIGRHEIIYALIGYKNYLSSLYGLGFNFATTSSAVTQTFISGSTFTVNSNVNTLIFSPTGSVSGSFTFVLPAVTGSATGASGLSTTGYI